MKYRTSFWLKKADVEFVRNIYPIYGAKNLSALINGLLYFFSYAQNPPEVDIRRLLQDALEGKVFAQNPEVIKADQILRDFLEYIEENDEAGMLSDLCKNGDGFLSLPKWEKKRLHMLNEIRKYYGYVLTESELLDMYAQWVGIVKSNGKFREAYASWTMERLAQCRYNPDELLEEKI